MRGESRFLLFDDFFDEVISHRGWEFMVLECGHWYCWMLGPGFCVARGAPPGVGVGTFHRHFIGEVTFWVLDRLTVLVTVSICTVH